MPGATSLWLWNWPVNLITTAVEAPNFVRTLLKVEDQRKSETRLLIAPERPKKGKRTTLTKSETKISSPYPNAIWGCETFGDGGKLTNDEGSSKVFPSIDVRVKDPFPDP